MAENRIILQKPVPCWSCSGQLVHATVGRDKGKVIAAQPFDEKPLLKDRLNPFHVTAFGALYADDCMKVLPAIREAVVDTVFADPPFNLGKKYGNDDFIEG